MLAAARAERKLSREQLSHQSGVSATTIYRIEKGQVKPNPATRFMLALALGVDPATLADDAP